MTEAVERPGSRPRGGDKRRVQQRSTATETETSSLRRTSMDGQQVLEPEFSNVASMCLQDGMQKVRLWDDDPFPNPAVLEIKAAALRATAPGRTHGGRAALAADPPRHAGHLSPLASPSLTFVRTPGLVTGGGEVVAGGQGVGVGVAEHPLAVGEGALVQRDGLIQPPGRLVGDGEVVAGGQGVGVGVAQQPLAVGEGALVQRDGLVQPPGRPVGVGEVVAGGQGVGVGVAQDLLAVGEGALVSGMASSSRPAAW